MIVVMAWCIELTVRLSGLFNWVGSDKEIIRQGLLTLKILKKL
jgi:hypothetical protein